VNNEYKNGRQCYKYIRSCSTSFVNFRCEVQSMFREISCDFMLVMFEVEFEQPTSGRNRTGKATDDPGPALLAT
jgi:hypothetical protein